HPSSIQAAARLASVGPDRRFGEASVAAAAAAGARGFVPVEEVRPNRRDAPSEPPAAPAPDGDDVSFIVLEPGDGWEARTSLFGEPER
ncbi:MAG TPA: hypothetical protein VMQ65_05220, partial [Candidatus Limnocylindria bacterium]|nr:hypothetical protein [Candidatus Limnocylindria bacterium]